VLPETSPHITAVSRKLMVQRRPQPSGLRRCEGGDKHEEKDDSAACVTVMTAAAVLIAVPGAHAGAAIPQQAETSTSAQAARADEIVGQFPTYADCYWAGVRGEAAGAWNRFSCVSNPPTGDYLLVVY
jgi:hypothetical protein